MSISPSAIEKFLHCQRQYVFTYVLGNWVNTPPGPSTIAGKMVHSIIENKGPFDQLWQADIYHNPKEDRPWKFTTNKPDFPGWTLTPYVFKVGEMARKLQREMPPEEGLHEHKFQATIEGIEFKGVVDYLSENYIVDFKTTGSDLKYAKTSRKLLNDVQRLVYSAAFPDRRYSRWLTGGWLEPEILVAERQNVVEDRERFKLKVLAPAEQMLCFSKDTDPLALPLPGTPDKFTAKVKGVCDAFGQMCAFAETCFPKKERRKLVLPPTPAGWNSPNSELSAREELGTRADTSKDVATVVPAPYPINLNEAPEPLKALWRAEAEARASLSGFNSVTRGESTIANISESKPSVTPYLIENLYIDCMPLNKLPPGEYLEYSYEYIQAASQEVATDMHVASAMLVDFGKGPHLVCAQLVAHLSDRPEPVKHLFLETRSAEGRACMQELTARSKFVCKGCY